MSEIRNIAIIGAGVMGRGIAQVCAATGHGVWMVDLEEKVIGQAIHAIRSTLDWLAEHEIIETDEVGAALSRIQGTTRLEEAVRDADCVIESVPESFEIKKEVFQQLDRLCAHPVLLLSNTSCLRISDLAAVTTRPERVAGFHWINPPYLAPVVEVIRGPKTSVSTLDRVEALASQLGKRAVLCRDVPGFLINRLQMALLGEAISLLEQGVASAEDIDNAYRLGIGIRLPLWGPLKINDLVGNKRNTLALFEYLHRETGSDKFRVSPLLRQKVERGELGLISGKGWYDFSGESAGAVIQQRDELLLKLQRFLLEEGLV